MSTVEDQTISDEAQLVDRSDWELYQSKIFRCRVYLHPEDAGFSVRAADLPGVASEGKDEQEALANITEACQGAIESYRAHGEEIPWLSDADTKDQNEFERLVIVHA